jgi:hypothetical protein
VPPAGTTSAPSGLPTSIIGSPRAVVLGAPRPAGSPSSPEPDSDLSALSAYGFGPGQFPGPAGGPFSPSPATGTGAFPFTTGSPLDDAAFPFSNGASSGFRFAGLEGGLPAGLLPGFSAGLPADFNIPGVFPLSADPNVILSSIVAGRLDPEAATRTGAVGALATGQGVPIDNVCVRPRV